MPTDPRALRFYFDYISPYAYIAWHEVQGIARASDRTIVAVPIVFAAVLNALGQKGPAEIPSKRVYTFKDAYRKAHRAGVSLAPPPSHPFNPLVALRVTALVDEAKRAEVITALFAATWSAGEGERGIESAEKVASIVNACGLDGAALIAKAGEAETKDALRKTTEEAIARGVFGVPTVEADGELFWGVDGLAFVADHLAGRDPVPANATSIWADLPASATRVAPPATKP